MTAVNHFKGRVAALSRSRQSTDTDLVLARRDLAAAKLEAYVSRVVAEAPLLSPEQLDRIAVLLRPDGGDAS